MWEHVSYQVQNFTFLVSIVIQLEVLNLCLALTVFLLVCVILEAIAIGFPDWAISTKTNQFDITSNIVVYVGFWQQCEAGGSFGGVRSCRYYQVSQNALPA